jgi:hypothetical protein
MFMDVVIQRLTNPGYSQKQIIIGLQNKGTSTNIGGEARIG